MYKKRFLAASVALVSSVAQAEIEEVIVSAQYRQETSMEVPVSITAINDEMLSERGLNTLTDIGMVTPGMVSTEGAGAFSPYIRGVGSRNVTPGNESPVASYIDGVYQYDPVALNLSGFTDVQTIEVLRGPQGTLFGRNATGGAIRLTTYGPSHEFSGHLQATYGNEEKQISGFVTAGITDTLSFSLSAFDEEKDPYIKNYYPANNAGSETGEAENKGVRAKLLWEPLDNFSALLSYTYLDLLDRSKFAMQPLEGSPISTAEARGGIPLIRGNDRSYAAESRPITYFKKDEYALTLEGEVDRHALTSISVYTETEGGGVLNADASPLPLIGIVSNYGTRAFQQELRIVSDYDGPFNWLAGAYYYDATPGYNRNGDLQLQIGVAAPATPESLQASTNPAAVIVRHIGDVDIEAKAIYGEISYDLTDVTRLTMGLRYNDEQHSLHDDNRQETLLKNAAGGLTTVVRTAASNCATSPECDGLDTTFRETTYRIVLNHDFNDDLLGYVSYNRGFKSGAYVLSQAAEWRPTEPEILDAYEVGFKGYVFDRTVQFTTSMYYYDYKDLQQALTDPQTATARVINAASATSSGLEFDLTWSATDNLTIQSGFSKLFKAEYDSFPDCEVYTQNPAGGATVLKADCGGTDQIVSPDYTVYLAANYEYPLADGAELQFGGVIDYTDEYQYLPEPKADLPIMQPRQDGLETLNLYAQWTAPSEAYFIKLWGNNLTNSDRLMGLSATTFGINGQFDRGRTYGATLGAKF